MKNLKCFSMLILTGAIVAVHADVTQINGAKVFERVLNDSPFSELYTSVEWPNKIHIADYNLGGSSGFGNRHTWRLGVDNGTGFAPYGLHGAEDTFEFTVKMKLDDFLGTGQRMSEAGLVFELPVAAGWTSEVQYSITPDGEISAYGTPLPFYSFTAQQGVRYQLGTVVKMGARYFRDTDNIYKWVWIFNNHESPPLVLDDLSPEHDFQTSGLIAGSRIGAFLLIRRGNPVAMLEATDFEVNPYPAVKGYIGLGGLRTQGGQQVAIEVRSPGSTTPLQTAIVTIRDIPWWNGINYAFKPTVEPGVYDIAIKGKTHLRKVVRNVNITRSGAARVDFRAINGDVDGDNSVTVFDYIELSNSFELSVGEPGFNALADLDQCGTVTIFDYIILSESFDSSGDE